MRRPGAAALTFVAFAALWSAPWLARARDGAGAARPQGWTVERVRFEPLAGVVGVAGTGDFRGAVEVVRAGGGVAVINDVALDDYLRGVSEVPVSWPAEAQRAQAIAARTYVLHEMQRETPTASRSVGAHTCATEACQVYVGLAKERREGAAAWANAVATTERQVLVHQGRPILAKYSSSNGGRSTAGGLPYLRAVDDADDRFSPLHRWRSVLSLADVGAALGAPGPVAGIRWAGDLIVVTWLGADNGIGEGQMAVADFRSRLNGAVAPPGGLPRAVPSLRFTATTDATAGTLTLEGAGFGHGVGMGQYGALGKALRGLRAADILAAYYGGLRPVALRPEQLPATIRVAVDLDRPSAEVAAVPLGPLWGRAPSGPPEPAPRFRVVDQSGRVLALTATGVWRVTPAGAGGVLVAPPAGQAGPLGVEPLGADPGSREGRNGTVRFRLSAPAIVRVTVHPPDGPPLALGPKAVDAGEASHPLPALTAPGDYVVTIEAEAGAGRSAAAPLDLRVAGPSPSAVPVARMFAAPQGGPPVGERVPTALALVALVTAAAGVAPRLVMLRDVGWLDRAPVGWLTPGE